MDKNYKKSLIDFHTRHKLLILSHSPKHYQMMGKLVAAQKTFSPKELFMEYQNLLLDALKIKATVKKHVNVLQHMMGYFKKHLTPDEKTELLEIIDRYRNEHVPLVVPMTVVNHYVRKYDQHYLKAQTYLAPHPVALKVRNFV